MCADLPDPIDLILCDPARDADTIADALIAYLDTGAASGTIMLENTFVAGESRREWLGAHCGKERRHIKRKANHILAERGVTGMKDNRLGNRGSVSFLESVQR